MPRYLTNGFYRDTGRDFRAHKIEAPNENDARALAADLGMIVREIWVKHETPAQGDNTLERRAGRRMMSHDRNYPLLQLAGVICSAIGAVVLGGVLLTFILGFILAAGGEYGAAAFASAAMLSWGIVGLTLAGAGQVMLAVRDMARNSSESLDLQRRIVGHLAPPEHEDQTDA